MPIPADSAASQQSNLSAARAPHRPRRVMWWLATGGILATGLALALVLKELRNRAIESGERLTASVAQVIEEQTERTVQAVDQSLQLAAIGLDRLEAAGRLNQESARELLTAHREQLPFVRALWVLDAEGRIKYDSDQGNIGISLADRSYFEIYLKQPSTGFHLGAPVRSRSVGTWLVSASRPLKSSNGRFAGLVVAAMLPSYFESTWGAMALGEGSSISLLKRDGVLLMRSPFNDKVMGTSFADGPLFRELLPKNPNGIVQTVGPIDAIKRIFSYRTLSSRPDLLVVVGRSFDALLAPWRQFATLTVSIWVGLVGLALSFCFFLDRAWQRRDRAEDSARQAEMRLNLAGDAAGIGVWEWDPGRNLWHANENLFRMMGQEPVAGLMSSEGWIDAVHPEDRAMVEAVVQQAVTGLDQSRIHEFECRLLHADGSYRWLIVRIRASERDAQGRPTRLTGVRMDVTARKQAEQELKKSAQRLRDIIDGMGPTVFIALLSPQGVMLEVNAPTLTISNLRPEDVLNKPLLEAPWLSNSAPNRRKMSEALQRAAGGEGSRFDMSVPVAVDRSLFVDISVQPMRDEAGKVVSLVVSGVDITERHRAELALRESNEKFLALADHSIQGIALIDGDKIAYVNTVYAMILGESVDAVLKLNMLQLIERFHPDDQPAALERHQRTVRGESFENANEMRVRHRDGAWRWVQSASKTFLFAGRPARVVMSVDINDRKLAEASLLESKRQLQVLSGRVLEAQEAERRRVAHELHDELGQSLTAIKINLQASSRLRAGSPAELNAENIRVVEKALKHVRELALALRPSMLDDLGLEPALNWLAGQTATRTGMEVKLDASDELQRLAPDIETACFRIVQEALTNIVRHAKATRVDIRLRHEADQLVLTVRDNGIGFDPAAMRQRALAGGSLGVLGMQERATLIGADLGIDSKPGKGSLLTLRSPWRTREEQS